MKTDHIIFLGDFNCDLLNTFGETGSDVWSKTRKLLHLFEQFDLQNIVEERTRVTLETKTLIDLIVTTKPELFNIKSVLPVGISDHSFVYATIKLRQRLPPPRIITIRNFKNFSIKEFQADLSYVPFHVVDVFEDKDDVQWAWSLITPKLLRLAEPAIVSPLTKLYARSITKGEVYNQWKKGHLSPVFEKDDPTDKSNYRPILLLRVSSKILESCISDTVLKNVTECDLLTEKQVPLDRVITCPFNRKLETSC